MKRAIWATAGLLVTTLVVAFAGDPDSIDDIMTKAHKSKTGLRDQIAAELKKASPDWADVQKKTKEFVALASALKKFDPPKGDKKSWGQLSDAYVADVKNLDLAAGKKSKEDTAAAAEKLKKGCMPCHDAHRD